MKLTRVLSFVALTFFSGQLLAQNFFGPKSIQCEHIGCEDGLIGVEEDKFSYIPPPASYEPNGERSSVISVTYTGFTPAAQNAFQFAVDIWASVLTSPRVIKIDANFANIGGSVLGFASADGFFRNFSGAPVSNTFYPQALANSVANSPVSTDTDVECTFNSSTNWYYGTDGNTPGGQFDFVTVVLHELGHGLGFLGTGGITSNGNGVYGIAGDPAIYDVFTEDLGGTDLTSLTSNSAAVANFLTGNNVYWNGTEGITGAGGVRPRLYAPSSFNGGSSYSHLNENTYPSGSANSLMTPFIGTSEAIHDPGAIVLGMFADMAWEIDNGLGCQILDVQLGQQTSCNEATQTYSQTVTLTYDGEPSTGLIVINGVNYLISGSPQVIQINNLPADGQPVSLDIFFAQDVECATFLPDFFVAPDPCPPCEIPTVIAGAQTPCEGITDTYTQELTVVYDFQPSSGDLVVLGQAFPLTSSPQTVLLTDLPADGLAVTVDVFFSEENTCNAQFPNLFTAPVSCLIDCSADLDGNGSVDVSDLLITLGEIGCQSDCTADFDGNGTVETSDFLLLLAQFGNMCE